MKTFKVLAAVKAELARWDLRQLALRVLSAILAGLCFYLIFIKWGINLHDPAHSRPQPHPPPSESATAR
jgi:hypothetical protein